MFSYQKVHPQTDDDIAIKCTILECSLTLCVNLYMAALSLQIPNILSANFDCTYSHIMLFISTLYVLTMSQNCCYYDHILILFATTKTQKVQHNSIPGAIKKTIF